MTIRRFIGFDEALDLILSNVPLLGTDILPLNELAGRVLAREVQAKVDSPSVNSSRMDGYAVTSIDLKRASRENPVKLVIAGEITSGKIPEGTALKGRTFKITTGAPLPQGADAVIQEEICTRNDKSIFFFEGAKPGQNVIKRGIDISRGDRLLSKGQILTPPRVGLLAAAGLENATIYRSPRVAVLATGDEVVAPGKPLPEGRLYASNMVEICAWFRLYNFSFIVQVLKDDKDEIKKAVQRHFDKVDAFVVSGGAWGSDRDLILTVLGDLNWEGIFHKVRMSPGKATGFGILDNKPIFCLPGSPSSNETAFLRLALPGLMKMRGQGTDLFPSVRARLYETVKGRGDWTQFIQGTLVEGGRDNLLVKPIRKESRLKSMAEKEAFIIIPEGREELAGGEIIEIQILRPMMLYPNDWDSGDPVTY